MNHWDSKGCQNLWDIYGPSEVLPEEVDDAVEGTTLRPGDRVVFKNFSSIYRVTGRKKVEGGNDLIGCEGEASGLPSWFRAHDLRRVPSPVGDAGELLGLSDFVAPARADTVVEDTGLKLAQDFCEEAWRTHGGLISTLLSAAAQAASGKGLERHGSTEREFEAQPIFGIPDLLGDEPGRGWQLGQAMKKIQEAQRFLSTKVENAQRRAVAELLGAIVYTAAAVMTLDDQGED